VSLSGADATVWRVPDGLTKADVAYLETHGVYAREDPPAGGRADPGQLLEARRGGEALTPQSRHASARSALLLAGAGLPGPDGRGNFLTAESIAALPLAGLRVAVLGACVTAQGDLQTGEGIVGLPRAFHLAGARHVVASLWNVPHKETGDLMEDFFRYLLDEQAPVPPHEALRLAQLKMRQKGIGLSKRPFFWAAWTVSGVPNDLKPQR
jgi:hypothetical protein